MAEPQPTTDTAKKINVICKEAIHKICSGQVVLDLAGAVKELVENSLDSGASCIEIKLYDYGKTCITVSDNGSGITEQDFEGLGLKHHTSKLIDYSDLLKIKSFGFRGEALSALSALSKLNIITRHYSSPHAFNLLFNKNGVLIEKKECAREIGTTIHVNNLFKNLPVRAQEFNRNIKKEFNKMIKILQGYVLVSTNVKISCSNFQGNKSNIVIASQGSPNVLDNITAVFGRKISNSLVNIKAIPPNEQIVEEYNLSSKDFINITWECYVSSCCHTLGRPAADKQFFYVNGRPCDSIRISKLINYIYHKYNHKQFPFVYLNIKLDKCSADINVTPDKRTILFTEEKIIFAMIKSNFDLVWKNMQGIYSTKLLEIVDNKRKISESPDCLHSIKRSKLNSDKNPENFDQNMKATTSKLNKAIQTQNFSSILKSSKDFKNCQSNTKDDNIPAKIKKDFMKSNFKEKNIHRHKLSDTNMIINLEIIKTNTLRRSLQNFKTKSSNCLKYKTNLCLKTRDVETKLNKQLTKESFKKMQVIGQFNLGFILTKLENDIFIIDQHASDEKFRFEKLINETKLKTQKLISPKQLIFSTQNEDTLIDNEQLFIENGFTFKIEINDNPGHRVKLTGVPVSYNWSFGIDDIEELIFLIQEGGIDGTGSNVTPRPSKIQQMLASRACRGAVMIGKNLSLHNMQRLILQMSQIENPWNCPHGRPTLRHFFSLAPSKFINH